MNVDDIWRLIRRERERQRTKWNEPHAHGEGDCSSDLVPLAVKVAVLTEEVGEVARAFLDGDPGNLVDELVQVAAVAVAILESVDGAA